MRAKRSHVLITDLNKSEQPDSNHDKLFYMYLNKVINYFNIREIHLRMINIKISNLTQKRFPSKVYIICRQQMWNRLFKLGCHQRYQHQLQCRNNIHSTTHFNLYYCLKIWYNQQYQIPIRCSSEENRNKLIIIPIVQ